MTKVHTYDATLSSTFRPWQWPDASAADGSLNTIVASHWQTNAWVSVQVPWHSTIDYVAIYNRADVREYVDWLNPFEVWVGNVLGDVSSSATKCVGPVSPPWSDDGNMQPFVADCHGAIGAYVTLKQVGAARYLTVVEITPYAKPVSTSSSLVAASITTAAAATSETFRAQTANATSRPEDPSVELAAPVEPGEPTEPMEPVAEESAYYGGVAAVKSEVVVDAPGADPRGEHVVAIAFGAALLAGTAGLAGVLVLALRLTARLQSVLRTQSTPTPATANLKRSRSNKSLEGPAMTEELEELSRAHSKGVECV